MANQKSKIHPPQPRLANQSDRRILLVVKKKLLPPIILMVVFAVSRIPGLLPLNFSAAYALMFCAGVYFPRHLLGLPLAAMIVTDGLLNWYYHAHFGTPWFSTDLIGNYAAYLVLLWLGRRFNPKSSFLSLLGGGVLGAIVFYLLTNTISWLFNPFHNPEYTKTLAGWIIALTKGIGNYPETWTFFKNTLISGGLFTALFAGAMKLFEAAEPAEAEEPAAEAEPEKAPEEART
jgi:hypothetical protein